MNKVAKRFFDLISNVTYLYSDIKTLEDKADFPRETLARIKEEYEELKQDLDMHWWRANRARREAEFEMHEKVYTNMKLKVEEFENQLRSY